MKIYISLLCLIGSMGIASCSKQFLDAKPDQQLATISSPSDLWALMDNTSVMNSSNSGLQEFAETGTDDFFIDDATWPNLLPWGLVQQNAYIFAPDVFVGEGQNWYWNYAYQRVFYANVALDALNSMEPAPGIDDLKGTALFHRAFNFFWIAQIFAAQYDSTTASVTPGIPLRLSSDLNIKTTRATMEQTYGQIIGDLHEAMPLLPTSISFKTRVNKAAAHALLARVYLLMQNYHDSKLQADSSLSLTGTLLDYNTIDSLVPFPFAPYNDEVLFHDKNATSVFATTRSNVDTLFYNSFAANDLRKTLFFEPKPGTEYFSFNGQYTGAVAIFGGLAVDEVYLTRAECEARLGDVDAAMADVNTLASRRYDAATFVPFTAASGDDALTVILDQRRKELCFRGLRWPDLRRLNSDPSRAVTITRMIEGQQYVLEPNSRKYTYEIPPDIIQMTGIEQNQRN